MSADYQCYSCGECLDELSLPWSRRDQCPACERDLHVCRMCRFFDPSVPRQCLEDGAEDVKEKERVNFCDWFKPTGNAFDPQRRNAAVQAEEALADLFGESQATTTAPDTQTDADALFRK